MRVRITPHCFSGDIKIPASKSHTVRQLFIASLANGVSNLFYPLDSLDTRSCVNTCAAFGAKIKECYVIDSSGNSPCPNQPNEKGEKLIKWEIKGNGGFKTKGVRKVKEGYMLQLDVGNSGTTLFFALAAAGLQDKPIIFTGDKQIQKRSAAPLLDALAGLGIHCRSDNGCAPITIKGPWKGGKVKLPCPTSQYLSALLIAAPLAPAGAVTEIDVPLLNEKPYIDMTLSYLKAHGIPFEAAPDYSRFVIPGGSSWKKILHDITYGSVPGDFSSAAFPAAAAAISGGSVTIFRLDPNDTQGDKFFMEILSSMGCNVQWYDSAIDSDKSRALVISRGGVLRGGTFDLNATPDLLPVTAAVAAYAQGDTSLVNIAHARIKETDRIAAMANELAKSGVSCTELPDGLIIHGKGGLSPPEKNCIIDGHGDHRIVMAFAAAALGSPVPVEITTAECAAATYPGFLDLLGAEWLD